jgi:hypothetical protein
LSTSRLVSSHRLATTVRIGYLVPISPIVYCPSFLAHCPSPLFGCHPVTSSPCHPPSRHLLFSPFSTSSDTDPVPTTERLHARPSCTCTHKALLPPPAVQPPRLSPHHQLCSRPSLHLSSHLSSHHLLARLVAHFFSLTSLPHSVASTPSHRRSHAQIVHIVTATASTDGLECVHNHSLGPVVLCRRPWSLFVSSDSDRSGRSSLAFAIRLACLRWEFWSAGYQKDRKLQPLDTHSCLPHLSILPRRVWMPEESHTSI